MKKSDDELHRCQHRDCTTQVERGKLFCRTHFKLLPLTLKDELYKAWNRGKCLKTVAGTRAYLAIRHQAIEVVNGQAEQANG